jgi:hypothetical protein
VCKRSAEDQGDVRPRRRSRDDLPHRVLQVGQVTGLNCQHRESETLMLFDRHVNAAHDRSASVLVIEIIEVVTVIFSPASVNTVAAVAEASQPGRTVVDWTLVVIPSQAGIAAASCEGAFP